MSRNNATFFGDEPSTEFELDRLLERSNRNIGRIITVFTKSGGCSGRGFTGLLIAVDCNVIELITRVPSAPHHPFGREFGRGFGRGFGFDGSDDCFRDRFGTRIIIPVRDIVAVVFNEI